MKTVIVIPARYASTRLPAKPLADILGKPMLQHVYQRAQAATGADQIIIATDDHRIIQAAAQFGAHAILTSTQHRSGTERLIEVAHTIEADLYLNVQCDEPFIRSEDLSQLIAWMQTNPQNLVGTLCHPIDIKHARDPNIVKVVLNQQQQALYFSRSLIPYPRVSEAAHYLKHIGIYAYRNTVLKYYAHDRASSPYEQAESLEQLRLMHDGVPIHALTIKPMGPSVDTPVDLQAAIAFLKTGDNPVKPLNFSNIRLLITDIDGVLTDGRLYFNADGEAMKCFHTRDGAAIAALQQQGIIVAVISGRDSPLVRRRIAQFNIHLARFGVKDKGTVCAEFMRETQINATHTAFIGDDHIDLSAFAVCGFSFAVADAVAEVKQTACHTLKCRGGEGALREVADLIL